MTVDEMAKAYCCKACNDEGCGFACHAEGCDVQAAFKAGYEDGYAQGQQDLMASNEIVKRGFADNLAKENAELKEEYIQTEKEYAELKIKHHDYAIYATDKIATLEAKNAELKAQIEKMKNCANCSEIQWCNTRSCDEFCGKCDKWEGAE